MGAEKDHHPAPEDAPTAVERATPSAPEPAVIDRPSEAGSPPPTDALPTVDAPGEAAHLLPVGPGPLALDAEDSSPRLGPYMLVARFPSSATADVFLGYKQARFGIVRRAVLKWVDPQRSDGSLARNNLLDEAKALSFIVHPNVVSVLDVLDGPDGTALALEYIAGTDLRRVIRNLNRRGERMPVGPAVFLTCEVLRALAHAHAARGPDGTLLDLVHRDVNPSNVLIAEDGYVKLGDFGTVHMQGRLQEATERGLVKGKVRYLAPEYITDQLVTPRVDLYSTGVMLFELLTGKPGFSADSAAHTMFRIVQEGLPYDELDAAGVPPGLGRIVRTATSRNPDERPVTARAMVNRLEDWMEAAGMFVSTGRLADYLYRASLFG